MSSKYTHDCPPGTDHVDSDGKEHLVHYPMPSDSIHDPLSWQRMWKNITFTICVLWIFFTTLPTLAAASLYGPIIREYHMTPAEISQTGSWYNLIIGLAGFPVLWAAGSYGRRPMLLFSNVLSIVGMIWFIYTHSSIQFLWSRNLQALGAGAIETLSLAIVGDLYFTQEAGWYHALGFAPLILGTSIGSPIAGAFETYGVGWRNYFWFNAAILIAMQFVIYFFLPETLWPRTNASARGQVVHNTNLPQGTPRQNQNGSNVSLSGSDLKAAETAQIESAGDTAHAVVIANIGKGYPSKKQRWQVFPTRNPHYSFFRNMWECAVLATFGPVILFAVWWAAIGSSAVAQNFVAAQIWQAPPYLFSPAAVGCTNIPPVLGTIFGLVVAGKVVDMDVARQAKANNGIREPEMRLRVAIVAGLFVVLGLFIYSTGLEHQWHWAIVLIPGLGLNSFAAAFCVTAISSYATDTYKHYPIEIAFVATLIKNGETFGLGYVLNDLLAKKGPLVMIALISIPIYFVIVLTTIFLWAGKPLRRLSAKTKMMQRE